MKKGKYNVGKLITVLIITVFTVWTIVPIAMVVLQSIKPRLLMFTTPPTLFFKPTIQHFANIFAKQQIPGYLINSLIVGVAATAVCVLLGSMAAYSLARFKVKGAGFIAIIILLARMVPAAALVVPMYTFMNHSGIIRIPYLGVIIAHTTFSLPFTIWMMRSFFQDIPKDLEYAAMIDGCSIVKTFFNVALPLTAPGLTATAILTLLTSWNEFMYALVLTARTTKTIPVGISSFIGSVSVDWGGSSAAAVMATVPIFTAGLLVQKYLVRGMTMGAVKE